MHKSKTICLFSCGAASAVATKLALYMQTTNEVEIIYNEVIEEHPDNKRFLLDCEKWFNHPIRITKNQKYEGSIYKVFEALHFIKGMGGATCTRILKRELVRDELYGADEVVLGFTYEEQDRLNNFIDSGETCSGSSHRS